MEGSKSSRMIDPQCPHIKSSPPVPDILLSERRIERFSVVLGPTGSMSIVAISSPDMRQLRGHRFLENTARSTRLRPMSHFCLGRYVVQRPSNAKNGGLPRKPRFSTRESSSDFRFRMREAADLSFRFCLCPRNCPRSSAEIHLARGRRFEIPGPAGPMGRTPDHWKTPSPRPNGLMARPGWAARPATRCRCRRSSADGARDCVGFRV